MSNGYTLSELINTMYSFVITKLFYKGARLIRRPFYIRGKKALVYGSGFTTGRQCRFDLNSDDSNLIFGNNCKIGDRVHFVCYGKMKIGNNCLLASNIFISDTSHGSYTGKSEGPQISPDDRKLIVDKVTIGNNVWVGENVCILSGVNIGDGCIIGANSVVTKSIDKNCVVVGIPGRVIKTWDGESWRTK